METQKHLFNIQVLIHMCLIQLFQRENVDAVANENIYGVLMFYL